MANEWMPDFETALDEGHVAVAAVCVVQAIAEDGQTAYYVKHTPGLDDMTALGMLQSSIDTLRQQIQDRWEPDN